MCSKTNGITPFYSNTFVIYQVSSITMKTLDTDMCYEFLLVMFFQRLEPTREEERLSFETFDACQAMGFCPLDSLHLYD